MAAAVGLRKLITTADDFGLSVAVNEAVEQAVLRGTLTSASLMVAGDAAADAVARARRLPQLAVGLHLVVIEGPAVLPPADIPDLVDGRGQFPSDQVGLGVRYFFRPRVRAQLALEIRAQFAAFAATGLRLDHANAHKHMHLHPIVGRMMVAIGREFGLRAVRVPRDQAARGLAGRALRLWTGLLRWQVHASGMIANDRILGLADTGKMRAARVAEMLADLSPGLTEMYFHPATHRDRVLCDLMPDYDHVGELQSLLSVSVPADVLLTQYGCQ